jgi:TatD DNase family protein
MFIDSHCHLDRLNLADFNNNLDEVVKSARDNQVDHMLCVSVTLQDFPQMHAKVAKYDNVSVSCGVHPLHPEDDYDPAQLAKLCALPEVVAVGETGLDFYYDKEHHDFQKKSFIQHIEVANQLNKPLIIHTRDAREETISILKQHNAQQCGGVLHCFTENWEMAKAALDIGFYISISGIATFKNAVELRDVVKKVPLDRLLIETDSPYLAPVPHRGKQNQPAYVKHVADVVAELKQLSINELAEATSDNFYQLFKLAKA